MSSENAIARIDNAIAAFFASGNAFSVILAGILVLILIWPILTGKDPDIHPFLLARQSQASPIRQPGESAVFRANEIPYGYPLRKGLAVKEPGAPAWSSGRDGDLRDIWSRAVQGTPADKDTPAGQKGRFLTVLGREKVIEQSFNEVTQAINAIGGMVREKGGKTVAVSLSNSVELLATIFASAFYNFKPVLIPFGLDPAQTRALLQKTSADFLFGEAGTLQLENTLPSSVKHVILVVKEGSKHIDWTEQPSGASKVDVLQWHDIVAERKPSLEVPVSEKDSKVGSIATFCKIKAGQYELVEYTSENLVAGIGGLLSTLVRDYKITPKDILLSTASLTESYALCWTLAALFSNASVALNSVAGESVDLTLAVTGVSPTIIVSSSGTITKHHEKIAAFAPGIPQKISNYFQTKNLAAGHMSSAKPGSIEPTLSALRVLLISQRDTNTDRVPSSIFAGLRVALSARTAYALTSSAVAGAVSQTNILDYRMKANTVCVGAPVSSLEVFLIGNEDALDQNTPEGKIVVRGPAVVGGKAELGTSARIDLDRTITLL